MNTIRTQWSETIDKSCPLNDYPRPQMVRGSFQCLNGEYDYAITPLAQQTMGESQGKILVPFAVETELSGVKKPLDERHALWYQRTFTLEEAVDGKRVLLHFGAVDWQCEVWVNGVSVGSHTGGYCPFTFDITDCLREANELIVRVVDPTDRGGQPRGKQVQKPVGFWYTATSGIWQTVWLEVVPQTYIRSLKLTPDIDRSVLRVEAPQNGDCRLKVEVRDGDAVVADEVIRSGGCVTVENAKLWSPEEPFLYDLTVSLLDGEEPVDTVTSYFGMRKFSTARDQNGYRRLCLNNKPYFQKGLLDQGYWPDGGMTAPSDEALIYDIQKMRELGFNMLRKHIKVEPLRWYYHCDRLGMLVWQDMPNGCGVNLFVAGFLPNACIRTVNDRHEKLFLRSDPAAQALFRTELDEMLDHLYNAVSICCWVPFNESWGQFDAANIAAHVKQLDPTRYVDHASGWHDQGAGDFKSIHRYIVPLGGFLRDKRALVISEYGGYSRVVEGHVWNRKKCFGYLMFKNERTLSDAYRSLHEKQVYRLLNKGLCALVYTQVSDVENEVNGILTYDRKVVKLDEEMIREINRKMTY